MIGTALIEECVKTERRGLCSHKVFFREAEPSAGQQSDTSDRL
mgnify:CR=1 FL=1